MLIALPNYFAMTKSEEYCNLFDIYLFSKRECNKIFKLICFLSAKTITHFLFTNFCVKELNEITIANALAIAKLIKKSKTLFTQIYK